MMQLDLRIRNSDLAGALQAYIDRRLRFAMNLFGERISQVAVKVTNLSGRREDAAMACRITISIRPFGRVTVRETGPDMYAVIDRAIGRAGRVLGQRLAGEDMEAQDLDSGIKLRARGQERKSPSSRKLRRLPPARLLVKKANTRSSSR